MSYLNLALLHLPQPYFCFFFLNQKLFCFVFPLFLSLSSLAFFSTGKRKVSSEVKLFVTLEDGSVFRTIAYFSPWINLAFLFSF